MDDQLDPEELKEDVEGEDELEEDDLLVKSDGKKPKIPKDEEEDSLEALADDEDEPLVEDSYDDVDMW